MGPAFVCRTAIVTPVLLTSPLDLWQSRALRQSCHLSDPAARPHPKGQYVVWGTYTGGYRCRQEVGHVFGRRKAKTHGQLVRAELNEGIGHLWQAAAHAAGGMGAAMGPRWHAAKDHFPPSLGKASHLAAQGIDTTMAAVAPPMEAAPTRWG